MCAPNKTEEGKMAFSYLFCTNLAITVFAICVRPLACHVKNLFIKHELHING